MKTFLSTKAVGFYIVVLAALAGIVSGGMFLMWGKSAGASPFLIVAALGLGVVCDVILMLKEIIWLNLIVSVSYTYAVVKLITDNVGSFVDKYQGINLFGDAGQVDTIISISIVIGIAVFLSFAAGFMKRVKE